MTVDTELQAARAGGFDAWLAKMPPAYFALVMATGIVAIACNLVGLTSLARPLAALNLRRTRYCGS